MTDDNYQPCTKEFALDNPDVSQARFYSQLERAWGEWDEVGDFAYDRDPSQYEFRALIHRETDNIEPMTDPVFESTPKVTAPVQPKTLRDRVTDRIREVCPSPHEATDKDWVFALIDVLDGVTDTPDSSRPIGKDRGIE